jgi:excisionase family DNA binding protein
MVWSLADRPSCYSCLVLKDATPETSQQRELFTVAAVARLLGVHRSTVYRAIGAGELEVLRLGTRGSYRVEGAALDRFLNATHARPLSRVEIVGLLAESGRNALPLSRIRAMADVDESMIDDAQVLIALARELDEQRDRDISLRLHAIAAEHGLTPPERNPQ